MWCKFPLFNRSRKKPNITKTTKKLPYKFSTPETMMENHGVPEWSVGQSVLWEIRGTFVQHLQDYCETKWGLSFTSELLLNLNEPDVISRSMCRAAEAVKWTSEYVLLKQKMGSRKWQREMDHKNGVWNTTGWSCLLRFSDCTEEVKAVSFFFLNNA